MNVQSNPRNNIVTVRNQGSKRLEAIKRICRQEGTHVKAYDIDPRTAAQALEEMGLNRKVKPSKKTQYARDMKAGVWGGHSMIVFDENGQLVDGQHRLHGVVESDTTQSFIVLMGLPRDEVSKIDTGAVRNIRDVAKLANVDLSKREIAALKYVISHLPGSTINPSMLSNDVIFQIGIALKDGLDFAVNSYDGNPSIVVAPVDAAITLAYYNVNHQRLLDFVALLQGTTSEIYTILREIEYPRSALTFRDWFNGNSRGVAGYAVNKERFGKCLSAIISFCSNKELSILRSVAVPSGWTIDALKGLDIMGELLPEKDKNKGYKTANQAVLDILGIKSIDLYRAVLADFEDQEFHQENVRENFKNRIREVDPDLDPDKIIIGEKRERSLTKAFSSAMITYLEKHEEILFIAYEDGHNYYAEAE